MTKAKFSQLKKFFSQFPSQKFPKGHIIAKPGDKFDKVYLPKSGYIRTFTKTAFGENTLNFLKPLFFVSVIHSMTKARNEFYFETLTPTEVFTVSQKDFKAYLAKHQDLSALVMEYFLSSLLLFFKNQSNLINGNAMSKVSTLLLQLVHDYGDIKNNQIIVNFPATHRIIANLVGLTRETTSVQMSKLQRLGVISTQRNLFTVRDINELKKLAQVED